MDPFAMAPPFNTPSMILGWNGTLVSIIGMCNLTVLTAWKYNYSHSNCTRQGWYTNQTFRNALTNQEELIEYLHVKPLGGYWWLFWKVHFIQLVFKKNCVIYQRKEEMFFTINEIDVLRKSYDYYYSFNKDNL